MGAYEFRGRVVERARKRHVCDGCDGEYPIVPDTWYYRKVSVEDGRVKTVRLCQRCYFAMQNKLESHGGEWVMPERGALRWNQLASAFRRQWLDRFAEAYDDRFRAGHGGITPSDWKELKEHGRPSWMK